MMIFMCTMKVWPILVKIFIFGVQASHSFFPTSKESAWLKGVIKSSCQPKLLYTRAVVLDSQGKCQNKVRLKNFTL